MRSFWRVSLLAFLAACPARAEQADPAMALEDNPLVHLLAAMAKRL